MTSTSALRRIAIAASAALLLTACGSSVSGEPTAADGRTSSETEATAEGPDDTPDDNGAIPGELADLLNEYLQEALDDPDYAVEPTEDMFGPGNEAQARPISFYLDSEAADPEGWQRVPAKCDAPGGEDLMDRGAGWFTVAVPAEWIYYGHSSAGSNSPLFDNHGLSFAGDADHTRYDYSVDIATDSRDEQGNLMEFGGGISDGSFDYEVTLHSSDSDTSYQIAFTPVGTVTVGDQQVEIFVAPQEQAPEIMSGTVYKARFFTADSPAPHLDEGVIRQSAVLSIEYDASSGHTDLSEDTVREIVSSLRMPMCTKEHVIVEAEMAWQVDLNDDGYVSTMEDYQQILGLDPN